MDHVYREKMVLMGGKGSYNAMRSNQTTHFGIMGGLAPYGRAHTFRLKRAKNQQRIPSMPKPGLEYMREKDILSKNPTGSGGVGMTRLLVDRVMGPCNCGADSSDDVTPPAPRRWEQCDPCENCPEQITVDLNGQGPDGDIHDVHQLKYMSEEALVWAKASGSVYFGREPDVNIWWGDSSIAISRHQSICGPECIWHLWVKHVVGVDGPVVSAYVSLMNITIHPAHTCSPLPITTWKDEQNNKILQTGITTSNDRRMSDQCSHLVGPEKIEVRLTGAGPDGPLDKSYELEFMSEKAQEWAYSNLRPETKLWWGGPDVAVARRRERCYWLEYCRWDLWVRGGPSGFPILYQSNVRWYPPTEYHSCIPPYLDDSTDQQVWTRAEGGQQLESRFTSKSFECAFTGSEPNTYDCVPARFTKGVSLATCFSDLELYEGQCGPCLPPKASCKPRTPDTPERIQVVVKSEKEPEITVLLDWLAVPLPHGVNSKEVYWGSPSDTPENTPSVFILRITCGTQDIVTWNIWVKRPGDEFYWGPWQTFYVRGDKSMCSPPRLDEAAEQQWTHSSSGLLRTLITTAPAAGAQESQLYD